MECYRDSTLSFFPSRNQLGAWPVAGRRALQVVNIVYGGMWRARTFSRLSSMVDLCVRSCSKTCRPSWLLMHSKVDGLVTGSEFSMVIRGVPRPDVQTDYRGRPIPAGTPLHSGTMDQSRAIQRQIYAQLGRLVCLEELVLGKDRPY